MTSRLVSRLPDFANRQAGKLRGTPAGFRPVGYGPMATARVNPRRRLRRRTDTGR
ncbi:hypothetical protein EEAAV_27520 (plasmid) [Rahnella aceris]